ncbi:MAG: response regulator transcription factor [Candidatus Kapabacteria bacterium]|jgi:two-component system invasion response regulator UvrY|nr:response regulator transcription factor [Candidatus Kapabacteria bacterium]
MIKIIIADDHAVVRKGLKQIFDETLDLVVTGEASNGFELIDQIKVKKYDVVILDISMPGKDGLDTLKEIKTICPDLPVLIFTIYPEEQYALRVLKAGAAGYVNKETEADVLIEAIRKVSQGRKYISAFLAELLASNLEAGGDKALHDTLSDREFQVMCLIASGKTATDIANELSLSINTISTYRIRILEKMSMKNNSEITHYALKNRLVD